jgi:hypothetical protein
MRLLRPREVATSIFEIDFTKLYSEGKRAVLFDLDNTLGERRPHRLEPDVIALLEELTRTGFHIGILTNRRQANDPVIDHLAQDYPLLHRARKPSKKGFRSLLEKLGASPHQAVMVGDRLLTDIIGANRLGIYSIRILP